MLRIATVCYDIFCDEMIFSVLCINSQPLSHVINVYIDAQMMILMVNANIIRVINHYVYILFFSPQRVEENFVIPCDCGLRYG